MYGNYEQGCRGGKGMRSGGCHGSEHGFGRFLEQEDFPYSKELRVESLKRKKEHLGMRKRDIDLELKYIDEKIKSIEK
jgi:hypothetical protein